jgi:hypothetical protein
MATINMHTGVAFASRADSMTVLHRWTSVSMLLQHCTPLYVSTVIARSMLAHETFSYHEIGEACVLATAQHSKQGQLVQALAHSSAVVAKYPAWTAEQRPPSIMQQLELHLRPPLQELRTLVGKLLQGTTKSSSLFSREKIWQGDHYFGKMQLTSTGTQEPSLDIGCFLCMNGSAVVTLATYSVTVVATTSGSSISTQCSSSAFSRKAWGWGWGSLVKLGQVSSWAAVEAKLRQLGLVHSDECLHMQWLVTHVN